MAFECAIIVGCWLKFWEWHILQVSHGTVMQAVSANVSSKRPMCSGVDVMYHVAEPSGRVDVGTLSATARALANGSQPVDFAGWGGAPLVGTTSGGHRSMSAASNQNQAPARIATTRTSLKVCVGRSRDITLEHKICFSKTCSVLSLLARNAATEALQRYSRGLTSSDFLPSVMWGLMHGQVVVSAERCDPSEDAMPMTDEKKTAILGAMKNIRLDYMPQWATVVPEETWIGLLKTDSGAYTSP
jgi:hypothetical protein